MERTIDGNIGKVVFYIGKTLTKKEAEEYARERLTLNYKNCFIGEVYVNDMLSLENVEIA